MLKVLNITFFFVLPRFGVQHLNFLWNHVNQVEKLFLLSSLGLRYNDTGLSLWISQSSLSFGKRGVADSVDGTHLEKKVAITMCQIQMIVSVVDFW